MTIIRNYPIFEDNQILTSSQLNDLAAYLDQQNRLTRVKLIGIGIACGLEVNCTDVPELIIGKGVGITSEGFLIHLRKSTFTQARIYHHLPFDYEAFSDVSDGAFFELLPAGFTPDNTGTDNLPFLLDKTFLEDKVVALFLECFDNDLASCLGKSCDQLGIDRILSVRPVLIDKVNAEKIWTDCESGPMSSPTLSGTLRRSPDRASIPGTVTMTAFPTPTLTAQSGSAATAGSECLRDIHMPRVLFDPAQLHSRDYIHFSENYVAAINATFDELFDLLETAYDTFRPLLSAIYPSNPLLDTDIDNLRSQWKSYFQDRDLSRWAYAGIQYFYDFLQDLILAYREFRDLACRIMAICCVDTCKAPHYFPKHLLLGLVTATDNICEKPLFRTGFTPPPLYNDQHRIIADARWMFQRLVQLLKDFNLNRIGLTENALLPVKATPSFEKKSALSLRSIPYYYRFGNMIPLANGDISELEYFWDADKLRICGADGRIVAYANHQISSPTTDPVSTPLHFDLSDYDFFRIEGHLGKNIDNVLDELQDLQQSKDLPFDVKAVYLNGDGPLSALPDCLCTDLQPHYAVWRNKRLAFLSNLLRFSVALKTALKTQKEITDVINNYGFGIAEETSDPTESGREEVSGSAAKKASATAKEAAPGESLAKKMNNALQFSKGPATALEFQQLNYELADAQAAGLISNNSANLSTEQKALIEQLTAFNDCIRKLIQALPPDLKDFELENSWLERYKCALQTNLDTMERIAGFPLFDEDRDTFTAYLVIYCFVHSILTSLAQRPYATIRPIWDTLQLRKEHWREALRFSNFIKEHPGAEHKAGAPAGGTFIAVYLGDNYPLFKLGSFDPSVEVPPVYEQYEGYPLSRTEASAAQTGMLRRIPAFVSTQLSQVAPGFTIGRGTVIADFSLPYRCCEDCGDQPAAVIPLRPIALPRCGVAMLQLERENNTVTGFFYRDIQLQLLDNRFSPADHKPFFADHSSPDQLILATDYGTANLTVSRPWEPDPSLSKRILTYRVDLNKIYPVPGDSADVIAQKKLILANNNIITDTFTYQFYDINNAKLGDASTVTIFIPLFKGEIEVPTTDLVVEVVTFSNGNPIAGATVSIDGVTKGSTNNGGIFSAQYPLGDYQVTASKASFSPESGRIQVNTLNQSFKEVLRLKRRFFPIDYTATVAELGYAEGSAEARDFEQVFTVQLEDQRTKASAYQETEWANDLVLRQAEAAVQKFSAAEPVSQVELTQDFARNEAALLNRLYTTEDNERAVFATAYGVLIESYLTRTFTNEPKSAPTSLTEALNKSIAETRSLDGFDAKDAIADWTVGMQDHLPADFKAAIETLLEEKALTGILRGKVIDKKSGKAIAGADLTILDTDHRTQSDEVGRYALVNILAGHYELKVAATSYQPLMTSIKVEAGSTSTNTFEMEIVPQEGKLSGSIVSAADGSAINGAVIQVQATDLKASSNAQGKYRLPNIPAGNHRITASAEGFLPDEKVVAITDGASYTADFALEPVERRGRLTGTITGEDKRPLANAKIVLKDTNYTATTDRRGNFSIDDIPLGSYQTLITAEGYAPADKSIELVGTAPFILSVQLNKVAITAVIKGRIRGNDRKSIAKAVVSLESKTIRELRYAGKTNSKGSYKIEGVKAGSYQLRVAADGYSQLSKNIQLRAGQTLTEDLVLTSDKKKEKPADDPEDQRPRKKNILFVQRKRISKLENLAKKEDELLREVLAVIQDLSKEKPQAVKTLNNRYEEAGIKLSKAITDTTDKTTLDLYKKILTELNYAYLNQLILSAPKTLDEATKQLLRDMAARAGKVKNYRFSSYLNKWETTVKDVADTDLVKRILTSIKSEK